MWPRRALFHSYSPSLVFHNTFQQPPEQCVRRPELARLSAVPTRGAVKDSHLDVFSNLDSGYRLRFPPLIWMLSLELHPLCLFKTKDQWISPVCQQAACRWQWGSDSQHQRSHRCQRSTGKPPSPGPIMYCSCVHLLKSCLTNNLVFHREDDPIVPGLALPASHRLPQQHEGGRDLAKRGLTRVMGAKVGLVGNRVAMGDLARNMAVIGNLTRTMVAKGGLFGSTETKVV